MIADDFSVFGIQLADAGTTVVAIKVFVMARRAARWQSRHSFGRAG